MSCNGGFDGASGSSHRQMAGDWPIMKKKVSSIAYKIGARPLTMIRIRARAGNSRQGWLTANGLTIPVALGRGGILANKREGDGGTPRGTFRPLQLWWRADRHPQPQTYLPTRPSPRGSRGVRGPARPPFHPADPAGRGAARRPADPRGSPLRLHRRDRPEF